MNATRRPAILGLVSAILLLTPHLHSARAATLEALQNVADGVYVHVGQIALTTLDNAGDIANLGVVVGRDSVAIIDTGGSVAVGRALLEAVRTITDRPVRFVINTHDHPDHVFGNVAMPPDATFVGHHQLPAALAARSGYYLRSYREQLGEAAVAAVQLRPPTLLVDDEMTLDLGDRTLRLTAWPSAHTDCDLTIFDPTSGVLFAGDLVFLDHVPVLDGSISGWLKVISKLAQVPARRVVPGHGRQVALWPRALDDERRYLMAVAEDARRAIAEGTPLAQAIPGIGTTERDRWLLFDAYNARNATAAFSELEWQ